MVSESLIVKFLAGEAESHEVEMIKHWRESDIKNEKQFKQYEHIWLTSGQIQDKNKFDVENAWDQFKNKITSPSKILMFPDKRVWLAAASIIILLVSSIVFYQIITKNDILLTSVSKQIPLNIKLSDGSDIILKNGVCQYPKVFTGKNREIKLEKGIAFFKVKRNEKNPFKIYAGNTIITVLGTEFEVSHLENQIRVQVVSGKVNFSSPESEIVLIAGQSAIYNTQLKQIQNFYSKKDNRLSYATGKLVFQNKTLKEVIEDLNLFYSNSKIKIEPSIENCRLTATFEKEKLENVLEIIKITMNTNIRKDEVQGIYYIDGKGCMQ